MDFLLDALTDWLKEMLVGGIMGNLSGMFDSVNQQVADICDTGGPDPAGLEREHFQYRRNVPVCLLCCAPKAAFFVKEQ